MAAAVNSLANHFHAAYMVISQLNLKVEEEQKMLELRPLDQLLHATAKELNKRVETAEMSQKLQESFKKDMDEKQREFYLRQQMKAIRKELGEDEDDKVEINELRKKVEETGLSPEARKAVDKELGRLERIPPSSPEYTVSRNYVDWILDLPWTISTTDTLDLDRAQAGPGSRSLRPEEDQEADHRVSGGAQAQAGRARADPLLCRPPRGGQDLAGPVHRPDHEPQVRAYRPRRHA